MKRPLVLVIISFILGIIFMNIERTIFYMVLLFCGAFLLFNKKFLTRYDIRYPISQNIITKEKTVKLVIMMLTSLMFGYIYANIDCINKFECINEIKGKEVSLSGIVIDKENNEYLLKNIYIEGEKINGKIKIRSKEEYKILEEMSSIVMVDLPVESVNFGGFNYREYLYSKNIIGIGEELYKQEKRGTKLNIIESGSIKIREYICEIIDNSYPDEEAQILKAILIGKSNALEEQIKEFYQQAGIIHILVVSGAHIVLIIAVLKILLNKLRVLKVYYNYILIFLIIIYIYITGAGESVLRAGLVSIIALIAGILGRQNDSITTIFLSAVILILFNPMVIYSIGFQLSFAGALGIILLNSKINKFLSFLPKAVADALSVSLSAQLFIVPVTAYHFNNINLMGMISSLFVMPIINLIMPLGFIGMLPIIREIIVKANYFLLTLLFNDAKIFSYLNVLDITVATPQIECLVLYYLFVLVIFYSNKRRIKLMGSLLIVSISVLGLAYIKTQELEINFINVGHGDSIFIITPNQKTILIDTGDKYTYKENEYNMAEKTVIPFILDKGHKNIDIMILSHLDSDHAGGAETILENLNVKQLIVGKNSIGSERFKEIEEACNNEITKLNLVSAGNSFDVDDIKFNVLSPFAELNETENNNSIVLMMEYKGKKTLFMGDLELEGEEVLVKKYNIDSDILKVGHHGSITSTTEEFVKEVTPQVSIISVGDRFDSLPSKSVIERLKESKIYITKEDGGVRVIIGKKGEIEVETTL